MSQPYRLVAAAAGLLVLVGCASPTHRAPVDDRSRPSNAGSNASGAATAAPKVLPGAENAGKPGYYTVKSGDTLIRISLDTGQNWRDLASWNSLENPNLIEVGQVLRVVPPGTDPATLTNGVSTRPINSARLDVKPLDGKAAGKTPAGKAGAAAAGASAAGAAASGAAASEERDSKETPAAAKDSKEAKDNRKVEPREDSAGEPAWQWPASGPVIAPFEEGKHKGLSIGGKAGDPVYASADGRVVYAGSGLRGYGNLIILKHAGDYLTAYAHNQTLLVKEEQSVRKGQKIAEMGATDADRVQLHFEIRKQGKPLDPSKQLPSR